MKKVFKVIGIFLLILTIASCGPKRLSGTYESPSLLGLSYTLTFKGDKVTTNLLGIEMSGTYVIDGNNITITFPISGDMNGKIDKNKIIFSDITLTKK